MINVIYSELVAILFLFLFLIFFIISNRIYKSIYNIMNLFNAVWLLFGVIAMQGFYGLRIPGINTIIIIIVSVLTFNITIIIFESKNKLNIRLLDYEGFRYNKKIIVMVNILAYIYLLPHTVISIGIIKSSGWTQLRYCILNYIVVFTKTETIFVTMFIYPIFTATLIILSISIISKTIDKRILVIGLIDLLLTMVTSGGRGMIFIFLICLISGFLLNAKRRIYKFSFRTKICIAIGIIVLVFITINRRIGNSTVMHNIIAYFIGPFSYFDKIISEPKQFGLFDNYGMGIATFGWITSFICFAIKNVLNISIEPIDSILSIYSGQYYNVSPTIKLNHTTTMIYPMIYDFGYLGCIIGPFLLACIVEYIFIKARKKTKNNSFWIAASVYLTYILFASSYEYIFIWTKTFFELFYLMIFCTAFSKRNEKRIDRWKKT